MLVTEYKDIEVIIKFDCPHCGVEHKVTLDREPDEFDEQCTSCEEFFTVKCYGDI